MFLFITTTTRSQPSKIMNAAEIKSAIEKLNVLGSVLYVAAHPDDENTAALAYFSHGKKYRTGYLSMTRGDGGQNLIGAEKGDLMGVIRTNELIEARKIDGVEQYFTRAIDFGYSKSPEETIEFWGRENILYDIVWVIRKFRPDVIVTRFPPGGWNTHGHHLASAILAVEAFSLAGDSTKFSDQLESVEPWLAKRIVWDSWLPYMDNFEGDFGDYVSADIGAYNNLLGRSYTEIAAESRSKHKSQGFGAQARRGSRPAYFKHLNGYKADKELFENIETGWERLQIGEQAIKLANRINENYNLIDPSESITDLLALRTLLLQHENQYWSEQKIKEINNIIQSCLGLWIEAVAYDYTVAQGDSIGVNFSVIKRDDTAITLDKIELNKNYYELVDTVITFNNDYQFERTIFFDHDYALTQPHWLNKEKAGWNFESSQDLTLPSINPLKAYFTIKIMDQSLTFETPVLYRWVDRVKGEMYRNLEVMPSVTQNFNKDIYIIAGSNEQNVTIKLKAFKDNVAGSVDLLTDAGWTILPKSHRFDLRKKYDEEEVTFKVIKNNGIREAAIKTIASVDNVYSTSIYELKYDHIPYQSVLFPAESKIVNIDTEKKVDKIGYIIGAGDDIPQVLETLGYSVDILETNKIDQTDLTIYDAIISGIRAYNTDAQLKYVTDDLIDYVNNGGRFVVQYNVSFGLVTDQIGPYQFKISRDRVTDENSEVKLLTPDHKLFNYPNKITTNDFEGWVQERGLYFANEWDQEFTPLIGWNDSGEDEKQGALLYSKYGKGDFIYTGISFFRQLPAGVPGAVRLFVNIISKGDLNE